MATKLSIQLACCSNWCGPVTWDCLEPTQLVSLSQWVPWLARSYLDSSQRVQPLRRCTQILPTERRRLHQQWRI